MSLKYLGICLEFESQNPNIYEDVFCFGCDFARELRVYYWGMLNMFSFASVKIGEFWFFCEQVCIFFSCWMVLDYF